jgi:Methyltransferase domain
MTEAPDATLIFPCCVPAGDRYAEDARQRNERVVAASSLRHDPTAEHFDTWFYLPSVHDMDFAWRLDQAVTEHRIARIYCPVAVAYVVLRQMAVSGRLKVPLIGEMPVDKMLRDHRALMASALCHHAFIQDVSEARSSLTPLEVAAVLRQSLGIYGESNESKIAATMAIFADVPQGDVVEIGALAGRSASVLALMARRHRTGAVLVVDSWSASELIQQDSPPAIRDDLTHSWGDVRVPFESFIVSLLPIASRNEFNYLSMPSKQAHSIWADQLQAESEYFGRVRYRGAISVLHIDANHDYSHVREDCSLWLPHLLPGGWLILDDYFWLHGSGPRKVGDELLASRAQDVQRAFVCGKALFLKLSR